MVIGRKSFYLIAFFLFLSFLTLWNGFRVSFVAVDDSLSLTPEFVEILPLYDLQQINSKFIFGNPEDNKELTEPEQIREKLPIVLIGVVAGPDRQSMVLLEIDGRQQGFRVGARLPLSEEVYVKSISDTSVVFERSTQQESLHFPDRPLVSGLIVNE